MSSFHDVFGPFGHKTSLVSIIENSHLVGFWNVQLKATTGWVLLAGSLQSGRQCGGFFHVTHSAHHLLPIAAG